MQDRLLLSSSVVNCTILLFFAISNNMNELERINKNLKIKASQLETKKRRKTQSCSVYKVKIDESSLNKKQQEALKMIFVESKWIYNDLLNHLQQKKSLDSYNTKIKSIQVRNKDRQFETRQLRYVSAQMKQSLVSQIKSSLRSLKSLKNRKIQKTGRLKYISEYRSINLKQYKQTYDIKSQSKIRIQNIPGSVRVNGLKQFQYLDNLEFANAKILNTKSGYYIAITTYKEKEFNEQTEYLDEIGIDFGIKTSITTSTGFECNVLIEESERIKKLQRSLSRRQKRSNNQYKLKLMHHERVIVLKKNVATTQSCPNCQKKNKIDVSQRVYSCSCGYSLDRDVHASNNMIILAQDIKNIKVRRGPTERSQSKIEKNACGEL